MVHWLKTCAGQSGWSYCERSRTLGGLIATAPWNAP